MFRISTDRRLALPSPAASLLGLVLLAFGVLAPAGAATASAPPFDQWLSGVREEARKRGVSDRTLDAALNGRRADPASDRTRPQPA